MKTKQSNQKVTVAIEGDRDTGYSAFIYGEENPLQFGVIGEGNTIEEVKTDFLNSWKQMESLYNKQGKEFPSSVEFVYVFMQTD